MTSNVFTIHPSPGEEIPATDFIVTINGQPVFTCQARVSGQPMNQFWPGYQRPLAQSEIASFASWDMAGPVEIVVISTKPVREARVRPTSYGIQPIVDGNVIRFTMTKPGQVTLEINGTHHALHLFGNPPEENVPDSKDPNVRYFGPGVHCPGQIRLESGQTLYLASGAVVYGAVIAEHAENLSIRGRGILDGSKIDRFDVNGLILLFDCANVCLEGLTLRDSSGWTVVSLACQHVQIRHLKIVGNWRYNADGIDFVNCQHCSVEDSFVRAFDDCIVFKGYDNWGDFIYHASLLVEKSGWGFTLDGVTIEAFSSMQRRLGSYPCNAAPVQDMQVRRCVVWNDWGRALEIGYETVASEICDLLFEDCDIIHTTHVALDIQNGDRAHCRNVSFRNIRVEFDDDLLPPIYQEQRDQTFQVDSGVRANPQLIALEVKLGPNTFDDNRRGHISGIHFQDITVTSPGCPPSVLHGFDAKHLVQNVTIENLRINGQRIIDLVSGGFTQNQFVRDITIS